MYFLCPAVIQKFRRFTKLCSADNGIVDQNHPFPFNDTPHRRELDPDLIQPLPLSWRDKGPSDIFIFDQPDPIGDPGRPGISQGGVQSGVRDADDHVCLHRVLGGKESPGPLPVGNAVGAAR